jgi:hypothetical protein
MAPGRLASDLPNRCSRIVNTRQCETASCGELRIPIALKFRQVAVPLSVLSRCASSASVRFHECSPGTSD